MTSTLTKVNDYTLLETTPIEGTKGILCRSFNFASKQLITIFREVTSERDNKGDRLDGLDAKAVSVSTSVSTAITSKIDIKKFSDLQSDQEVKLMAQELKKLKGTPYGYIGIQPC